MELPPFYHLRLLVICMDLVLITQMSISNVFNAWNQFRLASDSLANGD
jgi:hypothetical protein